MRDRHAGLSFSWVFCLFTFFPLVPLHTFFPVAPSLITEIEITTMQIIQHNPFVIPSYSIQIHSPPHYPDPVILALQSIITPSIPPPREKVTTQAMLLLNSPDPRQARHPLLDRGSLRMIHLLHHFGMTLVAAANQNGQPACDTVRLTEGPAKSLT